jgi:LacI family transcriptional regulator
MSPSSRVNRRPSIKEVADRAGVAISSVSRVLSDHPDVSDAMRERVRGAVADVGYRPDLLAQGLRRQKTMSVGFAASDISNPVLAETITGAERTLRGAGYSMLVTDAEGDPALDASQIDLLQQRRVDGLLLSISDERDPSLAALLADIDTPFVLVDRDAPSGVEALAVHFDHQLGMRAAAQHLVELGHRRITMIVGGPRRPARERQAGVESAFDSAGGEVIIRAGTLTREHGEQATYAALDDDEASTAIVAAGNLLMHGALRALRTRGVRVGTDISFVGCDDVAVAEFHEPQIALVRRDTRHLGEIAAQLLLSALDGGEPPAALPLPTEFAPGPSCAPVA